MAAQLTYLIKMYNQPTLPPEPNYIEVKGAGMAQTVDRIQDAGGNIHRVPTFDTPIERLGLIKDNQGEWFWVAMEPESVEEGVLKV
jgi:predicted enzyme related to lactoylglutathione lyase